MKNRHQRAALFLLLLILAEMAARPAFAESAHDGRMTARAGYGRGGADLRLSHPGYPGQVRRAPSRDPADDACDLPSTGCESYLAN